MQAHKGQYLAKSMLNMHLRHSKTNRNRVYNRTVKSSMSCHWSFNKCGQKYSNAKPIKKSYSLDHLAFCVTFGNSKNKFKKLSTNIISKI